MLTNGVSLTMCATDTVCHKQCVCYKSSAISSKQLISVHLSVLHVSLKLVPH